MKRTQRKRICLLMMVSMNNKAYNMDCMKALKEYPDGYFDLCVADPPYGIGITNQHVAQRERERERRRSRI